MGRVSANQQTKRRAHHQPPTPIYAKRCLRQITRTTLARGPKQVAQKLSLAVSSRVRYWPNVVALPQICIQAYRYQWGLGLASEEGTDLLPHLLPQVDSNQMPKGTKTHCLCYLQCPGGRVPLAMVAPPPSLSAPTPSAPTPEPVV